MTDGMRLVETFDRLTHDGRTYLVDPPVEVHAWDGDRKYGFVHPLLRRHGLFRGEGVPEAAVLGMLRAAAARKAAACHAETCRFRVAEAE